MKQCCFIKRSANCKELIERHITGPHALPHEVSAFLYIYIYIYIDSSISHAMKQCCFIKRSANCKNSYKAPHCWTSSTPTWGLYLYIYIYIFLDLSCPLYSHQYLCISSQPIAMQARIIRSYGLVQLMTYALDILR